MVITNQARIFVLNIKFAHKNITNMKRLTPHSILTLLLALFVATACINEPTDLYDPIEEGENPFESIEIPADFDWKTTKSADFQVNANDAFGGKYSYLIEVFTANPVNARTLKPVSAGYARKGFPFASTVTVPANISRVFIRQTTPDGLSTVRTASVTEGKVVCDFAQATPATKSRSNATTRSNDWDVTPPEVDPNDTDMFPTSAPADAVVVPSSWLAGGTETAPKNVIVNSSVKNLDNLGQYVNIYVTEDATLSSIYKRAYKNIYVLPGVKLTISGDLEFSQTSYTLSIAKNAELVVNGLLKMEKDNPIYNLGTLTAGSIHTVGTSVLYNAGSIKCNGTLYTDTHSNLYNLGTITATGEWKATGSDNGTVTLYNNGTIDAQAGINLSSKAIRFFNDIDGEVAATAFTSTGASKTMNYGEINISGNTKIESSDTWTNKGRWETETMGTKSYDAQYLNQCYLEVKDKLTFRQARFINAKGSYILTNDLHIENTRIEMYDEAFIDATGTTHAKGSREDHEEGVFGVGSNKRALLRMAKLTTSTDGQQHLYLSGNLEVACDNYPAQYANGQYNKPVWVLAEGAQWAPHDTNTVTIAASDCNAGWNSNPGEPEEPVLDSVEDPTTYSYLFEDMWPVYGDYDMNDMVLRVEKLTSYVDKNNMVSKFSFQTSIRAVGAEKRMAGALMLDKVLASSVKSVTYSESAPTDFSKNSAGVERNQTQAVIPLFDEVHKFMGDARAWFINTNHGARDNVDIPPVMTVTIEFGTPVALAHMNVKHLNFFIMTDSNSYPVNKSNRREVHTVDYMPTAMAETSFFGKSNDDSSASAGRYYRSKDDLPWGIMVPTNFRWPLEHVKIQFAYPQFQEWVTSGGEKNTEWWENFNADKVF